MKKLLLALIMTPLIAVAQVPQNIQKLSGALTQSFTVPSGVSITATGTGTIAATSATGLSVASGKTLTVSNSLTLAGTDGRTMTFPTTNATIARTDAAQTFTGTQTFGALVATTVNGNTFTTGTGTLTIAAGKTLTASNTLTFTGTDGSSVAFGAGGTVLYSGGSYVSSITGTTNQVIASASTGAVTLSLPQSIATTSTPTFAATILTDGTSPSTFGSATSSAFPLSYVNMNATAFASLPRVSTGDYSNGFAIFNKDANNGNLYVVSYGSNSSFRMDSALGTAASPTTLLSGTQIGSFQWRGYDSSTFGSAASATAYAVEDWTTSAHGSNLTFRTVAKTTTTFTVKMTLTDAGNLLLGSNATNTGAGNSNGVIQLASTSSTDGLAIGTRAAEVIYRTANDVLQTGAAWKVNSTTASTVPTDGSGIFGGGVGVAGMVNAGLQVRSYRSGSTTQYAQIDGGDSGHIGLDGVGSDKPLNIAITSSSGTHTNDVINLYSGLGPTQALTLSGTRSPTAWGTAGVAARFFANTFTDTSSSGTVASAVAHSFAQPTFGASSATTFTVAANVYIAGDVIPGSNVTTTNTFGLWNVGKSRFDGAVAFGSSGSSLSGATGVINFSTAVAGTTYIQFTTNSTAGVINIARKSSPALANSISGVWEDGSTDGMSLRYGGGQQSSIELGSAVINFNTSNSATLRAKIDDAGGFNLGLSASSKSAWTTNGALFRIAASTITDTSTSASATVATNVITSFAVPTLAATNVSVTYTNAATVYIAGIPVAGTNVTLTNSWALWVGAGRVRFDGGITTVGGATFMTTNSALTDGAGVALGTLATAPTAGNPTKWIGINDNGTTRYVPAW